MKNNEIKNLNPGIKSINFYIFNKFKIFSINSSVYEGGGVLQ